MSNADLQIREYPDHPLLGRKLAILDPASRMFAAVSSVVDPLKPFRTKTWRRYPQAYDQGRTSECVIYSGKGLLNTYPIRAGIIPETRLRLATTPVYKLAQTLDPWDGEDYDGTSCLGGAKAMKLNGLIDCYRWCFGFDDAVRTVSWYGPVQIGVTWYNSMFTPTSTGFLPVVPESGVAGGHAIQIIGVNVEKRYVIVVNSWGTGWGQNGRCYIKFDDLHALLADWGEALTYVADPII